MKENNILTEKCYECSSCLISCPVNAIKWKYNSWGSKYAQIDENKCIGCNICKKVCPSYNKTEKRTPIVAYAAISKSDQAIESSSGGIFFELALEVLERGGSVIGAAYDKQWNVKQTVIHDVQKIGRLQGSKYVKSDVADSYKITYELLKKNKLVLYSGTPCQVGGLQKFIKEPELRENLFTVDIICHGTPPNRLFKSYIDFLMKKKNQKITRFTFRDKKYGHRHIGSYILSNGEKQKDIPLYSSESSYFALFLQGLIYNDTCYTCEYACKERIGDITLGDFWGIKEEIPTFFKGNELSEESSVSAVMVNTKKGERLFEKVKDQLITERTEYERVTRHNPQLNQPSSCNQEVRKKLMEAYSKEGYPGIEKYFKENSNYKKYILRISSYIPAAIKNWIKHVLR